MFWFSLESIFWFIFISGSKLSEIKATGRKQGFSDGLARSGVWWAGTTSVITSNLSPSVQFPPPAPHWLSTVGWTVFPDVAQVYSLPPSGRAPPWHLVSSFPVHLSHSYVLHSSVEWVCMKPCSCSSVLNSPIEWVCMKILGIPPSLCLLRLSTFVILTNTTYISKLLGKFGW